MSFLTLSSVSKSYGDLEVLKKIELSVEEGGFLVLIGPSGCGKSTLLNMIAGLESCSHGEITLNERRINSLPPSERDIAMVFQSYALYPTMSVADNMAFGLEMRKIPKADRTRAVNEVAKVLQIGELLDRKPHQLSGGQRQRVAMGRALVRNPLLFLFDEPLSNLDAKLRVDMRVEIKRLHQRLRTTMVYVTHDQVEALTLATKIAVLNGGMLQQVGTPEEIYDRPANTFVAQFMGSPSMNLFDGEIECDDSAVRLRIGAGDDQARIGVHEPSLAKMLRDRKASSVVIGARPESITLADDLDDAIRCTADVVEPAGADTFIVSKIAGIEVTLRISGDRKVAEREALGVTFNSAKLSFFDPGTGTRLEPVSN